jgi:tetratricopeptide (TPR) repeat protein
MLGALLFGAYSNSFQSGLVFDNAGIIAHDPRIQTATFHNVGRIFTEGYWAPVQWSGLYRPFTTLSYLFNYAILGNGASPAGYHWVNLALHAANVSLVYALGMLVFEESTLAFSLAALWGLHPLLTESVTNIVGRADLLAAFGVMAGLLCHVRATRNTPANRRAGWLAALAAAQAIGIFSKESAAVLPALMLLYDLTWPQRATWRARAPSYAAAMLPLAGFFVVRTALHVHMAIPFTDNPLVGAGFWTARITAVKVIGKFLWLFLWPAHLSADYSYNAVPRFGWFSGGWEDVKAVLALAVLLSAVFLLVRYRRTAKPLVFFLFVFFIALAPSSNLVVLVGSIMAERFMYLPSLGLAGCLVLAIRALAMRLPTGQRWAIGSATVAIWLASAAFAGRTYARNFDWQDDLSLWTSAVSACPASVRARLNLGGALAEIPGREPEAVAEYQAALRIDPNDARAHYDLGNAALHAPGRLEEAIAEYQAALRAEPDLAEAHYNLGVALAQMPGRMPEAIAQWEWTLGIQPDHAGAHNDLGNALIGMPGRLADAVAELQAALRIDPDLAEAHNNLGIAFAKMPGRLPDAIAEFQAAARIQPEFAEAHRNLGMALAEVPGRTADAIAEFEAAQRIRPDPELQHLLEQLHTH